MNARMVRSTATADPVTGRAVVRYTLTDAGNTFVSELVADTPTTAPPDSRDQPSTGPTRQETASADSPVMGAPPRPTSVSEVLTFFEKCPRCGYCATATRMVREHDGVQEISLHPTCGLPCGWNGPARRLRATPPPAAKSNRPGEPATQRTK
ncbi:hypothetical protein ACWEKT_20935 [Nocardia takedensis]